jgi:hypothetical protein
MYIPGEGEDARGGLQGEDGEFEVEQQLLVSRGSHGRRAETDLRRFLEAAGSDASQPPPVGMGKRLSDSQQQ